MQILSLLLKGGLVLCLILGAPYWAGPGPDLQEERPSG